MLVSLFHGAKDNQPEKHDLSWQELVAGLSEVEECTCTLATCLRSDCEHKKGNAWSPATWPNGVLRGRGTVQEVACLVLDVDHVKPADLELLLERISDLVYILHSSHSDSVTDRCVRLVFHLNRPLLASEFTRVRQWVIQTYSIPADKATSDPSRLFFFPSRPADGTGDVFDGSGFDYEDHEGTPLNVDATLLHCPEEVEEVHRSYTPKTAGLPDQETWDHIARLLGTSWPDQERHSAHLALAGGLARAGWDVDDIAQMAHDVAECQEAGNGDLSKRHVAARSSVSKFLNGEDVKGWPSLEEYVEPEIIREICSLLGIGLPPVNEDLHAKLNKRAQASTQRQREEDEQVRQASKSAESKVREELKQTQALVPRSSDVPTRLQVESDLELCKEFLKKSKDADRRHDGKLLAKVLKKEYLTEHNDEDRHRVLKQAALALARACRPGTLPSQLEELLLPVVGVLQPHIPDAVAWGVEKAKEVGPYATPGPRQVDDDRDAAPPEDEEGLRNQLDMNREGDVKNAGHNIERILRYSSELNGFLRFNVLSKKIEVSDGRFQIEGVDGLPVGIKNWLGSHWSLNTSTTEVSEQLLRVARTWCSYDPVQEYLEGVEWDGIKRIGDPSTPSWLTEYCRAKDTAYVRKVGTRFLISAVARALEPGCKVDTVLILEGFQGIKKSTTLGILGGQWFSDTPLVMGDKDSRLTAACKWLVELAELKSLLRDDDAAKAFISQKSDDFRPPYGRGPEVFLRRCVFGGSTNQDEYLQDMTGNRRYWAVRVGICKALELARDRDQLWAEAVYRYKTAELNPDQAHYTIPGERWWFEGDEQIEADKEIESRLSEDPWAQMIHDWLKRQARPGAGVGTGTGPKAFFTLAEVAELALQMSPESMRRNSKAISSSMREAGLERVLLKEGEPRVWVRRGSVTFGTQSEQGDTVPGPVPSLHSN